MNHGEAPARQAYWEGLYNQKAICEALLHEGSGVAKALFHHQAAQLLEGEEGLEDEARMILLNSLNRSLYTYCLFHMNLSLTSCCYENRVHAYHVIDTNALLKAGDRIIDAYATVLDTSEVSHTLVEQACAYIQAHLTEELGLGQMSRQLFVSRNHLCHLFKMMLGMTFCEYVTQQRLLRARALLTGTRQSIDEIANGCGFHSSAYFATVFKKAMGMSPSAFRRRFAHVGGTRRCLADASHG